MKKKNPLSALLTLLMILILGYGLSWAVIVGIIKLITVCFGWSISLAHATGIWLILCLIWILIAPEQEGGKE